MSREEPQHSHTPLMVLSSAATLHRSLFPTLSSASGLRASGNRERSSVTQTGQMCVCVFFDCCSKQTNPTVEHLCPRPCVYKHAFTFNDDILLKKCWILLLMSILHKVRSACTETVTMFFGDGQRL